MNPNTKGKEGWTALEIAATSGVLEVIQILLADKRTVIMGSSERGSALHLAA
jgi:ankyrin repeat protein